MTVQAKPVAGLRQYLMRTPFSPRSPSANDFAGHGPCTLSGSLKLASDSAWFAACSSRRENAQPALLSTTTSLHHSPFTLSVYRRLWQ